MSLFGDDEDVGRFVMGEDGGEWLPFVFDSLETDRGCSPLQQPAKPMEQVGALELQNCTTIAVILAFVE